MTPRDRILIVLGMPRSGTSLLTHSVEVFGFTLPTDEQAPLSDHLDGAFEPRQIARLNDALLARKGAWWGRIGPVAVLPDPADMLRALEASFGDAARIVIKDPRLGVLLPAWRPVLEQAGPVAALIALRHPGEAATSLAKRNGIGADAAYLMWVSYVLNALEHTEGMARTLVLFPDWIDDIDHTLTRIAAVAQTAVPDHAAEDIAARFQPDAVHGGQQLTASDPDIDLLAGDLFTVLARHARDGSMPSPTEIAPFRDQFETLSATSRDVEAMAGIRISALHDQLFRAMAELQHLRDENQRLAALRDDALKQLENHPRSRDATITAPVPLLPPDPRPVGPSQPALVAPVPDHLPRPANLRDRIGHFLRRTFSDGMTGAGDRLPDHTPPAPTPKGSRPDVIVMSALPWGANHDRTQYLAAQLAQLGHRVIYLDPEDGDGTLQEITSGIHLGRLPRPADPSSAAGQQGWVDRFHALADRISASPRAHVVIGHPGWWPLARHLSSQFQITVDCTSEFEADSARDMIAKADHVIAASQGIVDRHAGERPLRLIRNGVDAAHFIREDDDYHIPDFLAGKLRDNTIRVGFSGTITEGFDMTLLAAVARSNPDFDIHLAGPIAALSQFADQPNITLHGDVPNAELPDFLAAMDVLILPFRPLPDVETCDPAALYEYCAVGRPTVATALPELGRAGDLVTIATDAAGFAKSIRDAAHNTRDPLLRSRLRAYALENDWSYRAGDLLHEMERAPLLSVIILVSGPATPTLVGLQALLAGVGNYPAIEVILVDNGSDAAARNALLEATSNDHRLRLIGDGQNLGFAKGANLGIETARGEFVLLLGNDAYVTPGALPAMARHLQRNPDIGVTFPLSNDDHGDGVPITTTDLAAMDRKARDLVTGYRGIWTPLSAGSFFCAMFRKADLDRLGPLPTAYQGRRFAAEEHSARARAAGFTMARAQDAYVHRIAPARAVASVERAKQLDHDRAVFETRMHPWTPHPVAGPRPAASVPERKDG